MNFSEFQKEIIRRISSGNITSMATFLIEICRMKSSSETETQIFIDVIQDNLIYCKQSHHSPYVLLPYTENEVLGMFYEFYSLLHTLEINHLVKPIKRTLPDSLVRLECQIVVPKEERENGIAQIILDDASTLLRENAKLIIIPNYNELKELVENSYMTTEEVELQNERWHRKAQFFIALGIALFTCIFGILTAIQNANKESSITIKNKLQIDTVTVKTISNTNNNGIKLNGGMVK